MYAQVYQEALCRRHHSSICSSAAVFRAVSFVLAVVLSFLVAYATGGFWKKVGQEVIQPAVHYSGDGLLILEVSAQPADAQQQIGEQACMVKQAGCVDCGCWLRPTPSLQSTIPGQEQVWTTSPALAAVLTSSRLAAAVQVCRHHTRQTTDHSAAAGHTQHLACPFQAEADPHAVCLSAQPGLLQL